MPASVANRHDDLRRQLEALHLDAMAQSFAELALRAAKEGLSHEAYLYELVQQRRERREQRRVQRLLREASLRM
jgi:DNA replication protein DnaC